MIWIMNNSICATWIIFVKQDVTISRDVLHCSSSYLKVRSFLGFLLIWGGKVCVKTHIYLSIRMYIYVHVFIFFIWGRVFEMIATVQCKTFTSYKPGQAGHIVTLAVWMLNGSLFGWGCSQHSKNRWSRWSCKTTPGSSAKLHLA